LIVAFGMIAPNLGSEFVPQLSEGAVAIGVVRLAEPISTSRSVYNTEMEKVILAGFPDEVEHVGVASERPRLPPIRWAWN